MSYRERPKDKSEEVDIEDIASEHEDAKGSRDKRLKSRRKDSYDEAERRRDGKWWE